MSPRINIDFRFIEIGYELYGLYDYWTGFSDELSSLEERETKKALKELEKKGWLDDDAERSFAHQQISDRYQNALPKLLNYTFLTMLYSISEFAIREIAREFRKKVRVHGVSPEEGSL
jgi:hypothetical protein